MIRVLVSFVAWIVAGLIIGSLFVAAYRVNPWVPVAVILLVSAAFGTMAVGVRR